MSIEKYKIKIFTTFDLNFFNAKIIVLVMPINDRIAQNKDIFLYAFSLAVLLFVLRWMEIRFLIIDYSIELYIGVIAIFFTGLGIWLALKLTDKKSETIIIEKEVYISNNHKFQINDKALYQTGLSKRELEVLGLISDGLSNEEIAEKLFISLNTIKTHTSNLFEKLEVKRRTQATEKAKRLGLIP